MRIYWYRKLTSRKFWLAFTTMIVGLIIIFKGDAEMAETVSGCLMSSGVAVAYIIGEGISDSKGGDKGGS